MRSLFYEQSRVDGNLIRDQHATEQPILGNPQFVYGSHNDAHLQPQGFPPPGSMTTLYASLELPRSRGASGGYGNHGQPGNRKDSSAHSTGGEPMLEVRMGWHDAVAVNLRRIGGGSWDVRSRCWIFPLSAHDRIMEALHSVAGVRVNVSPLNPIPIAVLKAANSVSDDSSRYCHIPSNLEEQLMPFQREGVRFGLTRGGRCLIGDEMGLGKTVQALALASAYRDEWPGLIISPSSLREQWADALHRWLGVVEDRIYVVHSGKDALNVPRDGGALDFVIISYNFLDKMV